MFAPNRMLTTKEQWLLVGVIAAVVTGCATLYLHEGARSAADNNTSTVIPIRQEPAAIVSTEIPAPVSLAAAQQVATAEVTPAEPSQQPRTIGVAIMGAVAYPDLYMVGEGMRVADLIAMAGGTTADADLSDILLTAPLLDETTLTIPELPTVTRNETQVAMRRSNASAAINPPGYRRSAPSSTTTTTTTTTTPSPPDVAAAATPGVPSSDGLINVNHATSAQLQSLPGIGPVFAERIIEERNRQPFVSVDELKRVAGIADKRLEAIRPFVTAP